MSSRDVLGRPPGPSPTGDAAGPGCDPDRVRSSLSGSLHLKLGEPSQVGSARRAVTLLTRRLGLDETGVGTAALAVTEVSKNLLQHAGGGDLALWWSPAGASGPALEVLAMDRGPGMDDVVRCFADGYSSAGTPGTGLGAVRRAATELDLYTRSGGGTVLWFRLGDRHRPGGPRDRFEIGAVSTPRSGEEAVGDAWGAVEHGEGLAVAVSDGLGHGPQAAEASREAIRHFCDHPLVDPEGQIRGIHEALRSTRGAAVAVAHAPVDREELAFAGVGNVAAVVVREDGHRHLVSHHGTVGHSMERVQIFTAPFGDQDLVVLHTDGINTRWSLDDYPGLARRHPGVVAGVLHRDFRRSRDDATVLVLCRRRRRAIPWER